MRVDYIGEENITEADFAIHNVSDEALEISVIDGKPDYFEIVIPARINPGEVGRGHIRITEPHQVRTTFEKSVTIELNDAANTRFTIPVVRRSGKGNTTASADSHH